ncbi:MAG TPA: sulfotransferase [Streptosporangiaceae bacterium]|nr:sulfotransferase [Streptosporangiaceae bacterium]
MALKVINAGLGRTGTTSLKIALDRLGFGPGYHMFDIVSSEERLAQWEKIVCEAGRPDWAAVFDGYTSAIDGPCAIYYRQIMEAFPEAKIILTVRDADDWYRSTYDTLFQFAQAAGPSRLSRVVNTMIWDGLFGGRFADSGYAKEIYHRHNQQVIEHVGQGSLLVYNVLDGWTPLCAFLGVKDPEENFPHVNDSQSMRERLGKQLAAEVVS